MPASGVRSGTLTSASPSKVASVFQSFPGRGSEILLLPSASLAPAAAKEPVASEIVSAARPSPPP